MYLKKCVLYFVWGRREKAISNLSKATEASNSLSLFSSALEGWSAAVYTVQCVCVLSTKCHVAPSTSPQLLFRACSGSSRLLDCNSFPILSPFDCITLGEWRKGQLYGSPFLCSSPPLYGTSFSPLALLVVVVVVVALLPVERRQKSEKAKRGRK